MASRILVEEEYPLPAPDNLVGSPPFCGTRTARARLTVLEGQDLLITGSNLARPLWNQARAWQRRHYQQTGTYVPWTKLQQALRRQGGTFGLHDRCFSYTVRRYNANLRVWTHQRRHQPDLHPPGYAYRPQPLLFEVGRNARPVAPWIYRLTVLSGDWAARHALVKLQLRPGIKMAQVKNIQIQPDLSAILTYRLEGELPRPGPGIAGIDLGIACLAAVAFPSGESILYSGQVLLDLEQRTQQKKQADWVKVRNVRHGALHHLTNSIIRECLARQVGTLVVGNPKHIRQNKRSRAVRMWAFGRITQQLRYKAEQQGMQVILVDERYTSQRCHRCGQRGRRYRRRFICETCSCRMQADVNAAFNFLNKGSSSSVFARGIASDPKGLQIIGPTYLATFSHSYTVDLIPTPENYKF